MREDNDRQSVKTKGGAQAGPEQQGVRDKWPVPNGLGYLGFQEEGIDWLVQHPSTLLADEMGVGKTIQSIGLINALDLKSVLIVCPASLKLNWN